MYSGGFSLTGGHVKKSIAILIDGGFLKEKIKVDPDPVKQAARVVRAAHALVARDEEIYRIFYYDCGPFDRTIKDLSGANFDFSKTPQYNYQKSFLAFIARQPQVAVRLGILSYRGLVLKSRVAYQLKKDPVGFRKLTSTDFAPDFQQKGVDMRIGLDVALLAKDRLVDRVALVTADSDFIPAMKLARREGIQVVLVSLANKAKPELLHHADFYRNPDLSRV